MQLTLARALIRQPRLLLLDDADQFAAAVGQQRLVNLLAQLQRAGVAILVAAARTEPLLADGSFRAEVLCLQDGALLSSADS
jgi:ABC-type ATPase involved in cell division